MDGWMDLSFLDLDQKPKQNNSFDCIHYLSFKYNFSFNIVLYPFWGSLEV